jgi:ubiquitin-like 1-activating enzyme E1 B
MQVYQADIERLLLMTDMWNHRKPPHSLSYEQLSKSLQERQGGQNGDAAVAAGSGIKDQRKLSLEDSFELFVDS